MGVPYSDSRLDDKALDYLEAARGFLEEALEELRKSTARRVVEKL